MAIAKKGFAQEQTGDLNGALASLEASQAAFPGSPGMGEAIKRLREKLYSPQAASASEPNAAQTIRDFYAGQHGQAAQELESMMATGNTGVRGAAFFYLGAARLEHDLLEGAGPPPKQPVCQRCRLPSAGPLGYIPLPRFVSPVVLGAWQSAPQLTRIFTALWRKNIVVKDIGGETGIRTLDTLRYTRFPSVRLQPLGHLSVRGARDEFITKSRGDPLTAYRQLSL